MLSRYQALSFAMRQPPDLYENGKKRQYEVKLKKALCGNRSINVDQFADDMKICITMSNFASKRHRSFHTILFND